MGDGCRADARLVRERTFYKETLNLRSTLGLNAETRNGKIQKLDWGEVDIYHHYKLLACMKLVALNPGGLHCALAVQPCVLLNPRLRCSTLKKRDKTVGATPQARGLQRFELANEGSNRTKRKHTGWRHGLIRQLSI